MELLASIGISWSIYLLFITQVFFIFLGLLPGPTNWNKVFIKPFIYVLPMIILDFLLG